MAEPEIADVLPSPADYNRLRALVGWGTYAEAMVAEALPRSLYSVCALRDGELVGMARVIGDGGLVYYVQDVIVVPSCQRQGIGSLLMDRVMGYIRAHASPNSVVGLMAAQGKEAVYEKYGFARRPNERLGAGMTIFWRG